MLLAAAVTACGGSDAAVTAGATASSAAVQATPSTAAAAGAETPSSETSVAAGPTSNATPMGTAAPVASKLPAIDVVNVNTGETVNLASLGGGDKPILFWAWAPH